MFFVCLNESRNFFFIVFILLVVGGCLYFFCQSFRAFWNVRVLWYCTSSGCRYFQAVIFVVLMAYPTAKAVLIVVVVFATPRVVILVVVFPPPTAPAVCVVVVVCDIPARVVFFV